MSEANRDIFQALIPSQQSIVCLVFCKIFQAHFIFFSPLIFSSMMGPWCPDGMQFDTSHNAGLGVWQGFEHHILLGLLWECIGDLLFIFQISQIQSKGLLFTFLKEIQVTLESICCLNEHHWYSSMAWLSQIDLQWIPLVFH